MKQYLKNIERRLNLPRDIQKRVMADLSSSIEERREAGMTDEAIMAELGAPKEVAADLNEQMKEYAYRKSPWRFLFLAVAVIAGVKLLGDGIPVIVSYWLLRFFAMTHPGSTSVGIIGGADGPTAIFVTQPDWVTPVLMLIVLAVGIFGFLRLRKCKQK